MHSLTVRTGQFNSNFKSLNVEVLKNKISEIKKPSLKLIKLGF